VTGDWGGASDLNAPHTSVNFLKSLVDCLNYEEFTLEGYKPSYFDRHIVGMHFYHNLAFIQKGDNDEGSNWLGKRF
jgi:demethylmacrocin O-methyltransferase